MNVRPLGAAALEHALSLRDLTDPSSGPHAMQELVASACDALGRDGCIVHEHRGPRVVELADNYDRLRFPAETVTRDARYTRYVTDTTVLRTHTSALVPACLRALATAQPEHDVMLVVPGVVYRRDCIDRLHSGEPHQLDLWRARTQPGAPRLGSDDLARMIAIVASALLPGRRWRTSPAAHPYTLEGRQIDVENDGEWIEIGECGLAHPEVLAAAGLDAATGLAMGLGLDRILMLRKGIPDIRLLRSEDPRVRRQMLDLTPYRSVSTMPAVRRDLSIAVGAQTDAEELGDRVRAALGASASSIEEVAVVSETPFAALPAVARERLGLSSGQKNVLLRIVLRDLSRTLTHGEANDLRNAVYAALHEGSVHAWAR